MKPMSALLAGQDYAITEGSVFELLRRDPRIAFDPLIAHSGLIYEPSSRALLARTHQAYLEIASESGIPMIAFADTWRASATRVGKSRFAGADVNRDNIDFLRDTVLASKAPAYVGALTGPRGDAYRPDEAPSIDEALRYHESQIAELASAHPDLIVAATLPSLPEASAIALLLAETAVPWMVSFVVYPSGRLLDGTPLDRAIGTIDALVARPPAGYSINCVHPDVARQALLQTSEEARRRVILFQGNTSARPPEELDGLSELESSDPDEFTESILALMDASSVRIVGGCCGTNESHIRALAQALRERR